MSVLNPNTNNRFGDLAFFPATGPAGTTCWMCQFLDCSMFKTHEPKHGKCRKAAELRGQKVTSLSKISISTPSCKYFVRKAANDDNQGQ